MGCVPEFSADAGCFCAFNTTHFSSYTVVDASASANLADQAAQNTATLGTIAAVAPVDNTGGGTLPPPNNVSGASSSVTVLVASIAAGCVAVGAIAGFLLYRKRHNSSIPHVKHSELSNAHA
jgi:hypothetical protein